MTQTVTARIDEASAILRNAPRASGPALRAFAAIAELWNLSPKERQAILGLAPSTFYAYAKKADSARLSPDTLERISYVLGIFKALRILLPRAEARSAWLHNPNSDPEFAGAAPIAVMAGGKVANLYRVRRYLDGQRGW
ncbi:MAG: MbcA/ParS/Xre antitoxin family protein [Candidatus Eremiobacteraeota bacterium]|nr:MbcA/ParS/Xre antitoxin family protein [Candidatus Eremiobacteraeota bacterium]